MSEKREGESRHFEATAVTSWTFIPGYTRPAATEAAAVAPADEGHGSKLREEGGTRAGLQTPPLLMM
ncbi:Uncharacterised protein [Ralstonia pickettii]|nr:hypothetical protein DP23_4469 [Ralstonia pickettii]QQK36973.1 hypothetical protein RP6297_03211 [Ralstonia pickettii]SUE01067.1 Uncharacterised protein [Ralstonia pickettii]